MKLNDVIILALLIINYKGVSQIHVYVNMKLLYRATKDGLNSANLIEKINKNSNLIFLYHTGNKRIFGAYIKTKLEDIIFKKYYKDENSFVFNLKNNTIYKIITPETAIVFYKTDIIGIGNTGEGNGFYFNSRTIVDSGLLNEPKIYNFKKNYELTEKLNTFTELEIFEVNFN